MRWTSCDSASGTRVGFFQSALRGLVGSFEFMFCSRRTFASTDQ